MSAFTRNLSHTCTIERPSRTRAANGEVVESAVTVQQDVPCRYVQKTVRIAGQDGSVLKLSVLLLAPGTDIQELDVVKDINLTPSAKTPSLLQTAPASGDTTRDAAFVITSLQTHRTRTRVHHVTCELRAVE